MTFGSHKNTINNSSTKENFMQVSDFGNLEQIGTGQYGFVFKTIHLPSQQPMAVKKTICTREQYNELAKLWNFILDLHASRQEEGREFIVDFYGTIFFDSDCWLCMELMDVSLDKFAQFVYNSSDDGDFIPEFVIAQIARSMIMALNFLELHSQKLRRKSYNEVKETHSVTTRCCYSTPFADVKTSNVLISRSGFIKLCDLGMCRRLIDPSASSQGGEWFHYIAPERICPTSAGAENSGMEFFDCRADVWAVGISLYEITTGTLPFSNAKLAFQVIAAIVNEPSPKLEPQTDRRSTLLSSFVNYCLTKEAAERPNFHQLLEHEFLAKAAVEHDIEKLSCYFGQVLDRMACWQDAKRMADQQAEQQRRLSTASSRRKSSVNSTSASTIKHKLSVREKHPNVSFVLGDD